MLDFQKYLNAPTQTDGNYLYIQNPDTGQWEIAHHIQVGTNDPEGNPGAYNPDAGEMPVNQAQAVLVPRSVAQQVQPADWQNSVVQYGREGMTLDSLMQDYAVPALMALTPFALGPWAAATGASAYGPAALIGQATGLGPVTSSALAGAAQAGLQGGNPITGGLTSGAMSAAWPYLPDLKSSLGPSGDLGIIPNSFPDESGPVFTGSFNPNGSGFRGISDASVAGTADFVPRDQFYNTGLVFRGTFDPTRTIPLGTGTTATGPGTVDLTKALAGAGLAGAAALGGSGEASTRDRTGDPQMSWDDWLNEITGGPDPWGSDWRGSIDNSGLFDPSTPGFQEVPNELETGLKSLLGIGTAADKFWGGSSDSLGGSILKSLFGDSLSGGGLLGAAFNSTPFLLAMAEANKQGGDIKNTIGDYKALIPQYQALGTNAGNLFGDLNSRLRALSGTTTSNYDTLLGDVTGNESPFVTSIVNPLREQQATGYGNLLQSQALRGIRGSSFGDQSAANFLTDTGRGISDATAKALESSYGLRSNILGARDAAARSALGMEGANLGAINQAGLQALQGQSGLFGNILGAQNAASTARNLLLGAGLSASGRLFQPANPFNLQQLLGLGGAF